MYKVLKILALEKYNIIMSAIENNASIKPLIKPNFKSNDSDEPILRENP
jgi:hypothetical protein